MPTVDLTQGGTVDFAEHVSVGLFTFQIVLDFSTTSRASGDVLQILNVLAGTKIISVTTNVETVEGATLTYDVGDGGNVDRFLDGIDGNSAGYIDSTTEAGALAAGGFMYTADDTIDFLLNDAAATARIHIAISLLRHTNILGATA